MRTCLAPAFSNILTILWCDVPEIVAFVIRMYESQMPCWTSALALSTSSKRVDGVRRPSACPVNLHWDNEIPFKVFVAVRVPLPFERAVPAAVIRISEGLQGLAEDFTTDGMAQLLKAMPPQLMQVEHDGEIMGQSLIACQPQSPPPAPKSPAICSSCSSAAQ